MKITFIEYNGAVHVVEGEAGQSVMDLAVKHGIPGVVGDCGGACACATCHIHVDPRWLAATGEAGDMETSLLEFARDPDANSRLSCQIKVSPALDGLIVHLPESQY
ncbi:2Fe-2S iron-sulfur cluster-binding protein [Sphingomonas flavalba]|uniref:2Fe-2S iron-sulfur cluster-binding protein n=1 Tax=Sphingomonas flavalba TaxID=2559804 RepID=UPI0039DFF092